MAFTALLIAINFRLGVFVNDFTWYAKLRGIRIVEVPCAIQARLTNGFAEVIDLPVFLLATAVAVTVLLRRRGVAGVNLLFVLVAGVGLVPVVNVPALTSLGTVGAWLVIVCGIGLIGEDKALRYVLGGVAVFVFAVSQSYTVASALTSYAEASNAYTAIRERLVTERRPKGVDDIAARFVYSYRLPPNAYA